MNGVVKSLLISAVGCAAAACNCYHEEPQADFRVGQVLCTDGSVMPLCEYIKTDSKDAVGLVFYVNNDPEIQGRGYAVYLHDIDEHQFAAELGYSQGTSRDLLAYDGNENTFAVYSCGEVQSPMAEAVANLWTYGQSAYVPSVAQSKLLAAQRTFLNERLAALGGDPLPDEAEGCWYWTSTEVDGQETDRAWLFSMNGAFQETPKNQAHKIRPVVTIR